MARTTTPRQAPLGRVLWAFAATLAACAAALAAGQGAAAQEGAGLAIDQVILEDGGRRLTALVSLSDASGRPVEGPPSFEAAVDGTPVTLDSVTSVVDGETGIAVLLLIDVSGSMTGEPLAQARAAVEAFVQGLPPQDRAALLPFAGSAPREAIFVPASESLAAEARALTPQANSGTALYDSVVSVFAAAERAPLERRAVLLLTDGRESGASTATGDRAIEAALASTVPLYSIALGDNADRDFLGRLTDASGGALYRAPTPADVRSIFETISLKLRGQYAISLELPPGDTLSRDLSVSADAAGTPVSAQATFPVPAELLLARPRRDAPPWLWPLAVGAPGLVVAAALFASWRRRRRYRSKLRGGPGDELQLPSRPPPLPRDAVTARLTVLAGPNAGVSVQLLDGPVDIGSGATCALRLDSAEGAVAEWHARGWLQGGRLLLRHVARGRETLVDEKPVEWASLDLNDTMRIGPHVVAFASEP